MTPLEPLDDGVRSFRPGLKFIVTILLVIGLGGWLYHATSQRHIPEPEPTESPIIAEVEKAKLPPSLHPLSGKRRLYLADGARHRFHELSFAHQYSEQHSHPGAILRENDPCLWNFVAVPDEKDTYRIYCADPNYPEHHDKNLTYTRTLDHGIPQDDQPPYLTLRNDDPCAWHVKKLSHQDQYEIYCTSGQGPFENASLGWTDELEDLAENLIPATLGENGNPSWFILSESQPPNVPRRVTHVIIMPRGEIEHYDEALEHFEKHGHQIFRLRIKTAEDDLLRTAESIDQLTLLKSLNSQGQNDRIINHPDFPPLLTINKFIDHDEASPFPLIVPLKIALHTHHIHELKFENTKFWINNWEHLENLQSHLDETDAADGRVYQSENFNYFFVNLTE